MAIYKNTPPVVTNGLVLCLDAANTKSYTSGSTTVKDLSATATTATLFNTPTFTNNTLGFASANSQYATLPSIGDLPLWTVEALVKFNATYNTKVAMVIGNQYNGSNKLNFTIGTNNAPTNYNIAVGFFDGAWHSTTGVTYGTNTWIHITGTYDGTTIRQFTNGVQVDSLSYTGTPSSGGEIRINRRWDDVVSSGNLFDTNLALTRIYNRALSAQEVLQNYNALKNRFNLT